MSYFNIGDKVIALMDYGEAEPYGIVEGKEYIIRDIYTCSCGSISLNVGVMLPGILCKTRCSCGELVPGTGIWWLNSKRFTKFNGMTDFMEIFTTKNIEAL